MLKLSDFDYILPQELIAKYPLKERRMSRLLHLDRTSGKIQHRMFSDIISLIEPNDIVIFNNSRVLPARLIGRKSSGGKVEVLVERVVDQNQVWAHVYSNRVPAFGSRLILEEQLEVEVIGRLRDLFLLRFLMTESIFDILDRFGHVPLPPYIRRHEESIDRERYQTVYAEEKGSVAAPTAGLHFDLALLHELQNKGARLFFLTLHVGSATFQPVRKEDIKEHQMHTEWVHVSQEICDEIMMAKKKGQRIIAVGTTTARALETAALTGEIKPLCGDTSIFIYPGFPFRVVDTLITNFHLPKSTLLMLVSAFAGRAAVLQAYEEAIREKYRFFSYGDAMFIDETKEIKEIKGIKGTKT